MVRELCAYADIERLVMVRSPQEARQATQAGADQALHWPIGLLLFRAVLWGVCAEFRLGIPQAAPPSIWL